MSREILAFSMRHPLVPEPVQVSLESDRLCVGSYVYGLPIELESGRAGDSVWVRVRTQQAQVQHVALTVRAPWAAAPPEEIPEAELPPEAFTAALTAEALLAGLRRLTGDAVRVTLRAHPTQPSLPCRGPWPEDRLFRCNQGGAIDRYYRGLFEPVLVRGPASRRSVHPCGRAHVAGIGRMAEVLIGDLSALLEPRKVRALDRQELNAALHWLQGTGAPWVTIDFEAV